MKHKQKFLEVQEPFPEKGSWSPKAFEQWKK
jgi:hypothetical protein